MKYFTCMVVAACLAGMSISEAIGAEELGFESENICSNDGEIDRDKLSLHRLAVVDGNNVKSMLERDPDIRPVLVRNARIFVETDFALGLFLNAGGHDPALFDIRRVNSPRCTGKGPITRDEFLNTRCIVALCVAKKSDEAGKSKKKNSLLADGEFRLREEPKNLRIGSSEKTAKPATFSVNQNFRDEVFTANAKLAAGIALAGYLTKKKAPDGSLESYNPFSFIPFATYERRTGKTEVNKVGGGVYFDAFFGNTDGKGIGNTIALQTQFLTDDEADSSIVDGQLLYYPSLPLPGFRKLVPFGPDGSLAFFVEPHGIFEFGHVFDAGGNVRLAETSEYARLGGEIRLIVTGNPAGQNAFLKKTKLSLAYKRLYGFSGPVDDLERFEAALDYTFGDQDRFGIGLKYFDGFVETTLQEDQYIEGSFNVKF